MTKIKVVEEIEIEISSKKIIKMAVSLIGAKMVPKDSFRFTFQRADNSVEKIFTINAK